jgi:two-component system cell cycle response regulator
MSTVIAQRPRWVRGVFALLLVWLAVYELHAIFAPGLGRHDVFDKRVHLVVLLCASALIFWRAVRRREERAAWALIGAGVLAWSVGEVYYTLALWNLANIPIPSAADGGYLAFPLLTFAGICLLARARVQGSERTLWADGLAAALAVGAVSAAIVLDEVLRHTTGHPLAVITNLAYPVTDLVLLGSCVAVVALRGWRLDRTWTLIGIGVVAFWVADSLYLIKTAQGTYTPGGVFDIGWWLGLVLIAIAAWQPAAPVTDHANRTTRGWMIALPVGFGTLAAGVLAYGSLRGQPLNVGAVGLALAALAAVGLRLVITFRASLTLLRAVRAESLTDALTGMPNRRALTLALERSTLTAHRDHTPFGLALYDLDGFKRYNDAFGHQAGDALLVRLGGALLTTIDGRGSAYRMGGDEFCVLLSGELSDTLAALDAGSHALSEHGEGFSVTSSWGAVSVPEEASTPEAALRIADQRMYSHKQDGRPSASRQSTDVLLRALAERHPDLDHHSHDVASLAETLAARLGLPSDEVQQVRLAAELHDIGKVAIPETILNKPGPLDDHEWEYVRRHSVIGERIIAAAPSLQRVAQIVRSSHERVDGHGYPDGLHGDAIAVGARIIAVCDAYDAMIATRPYSAPMPHQAAITELRRCAGSQFDPIVVEAFCVGMTEEGSDAPRGPLKDGQAQGDLSSTR